MTDVVGITEEGTVQFPKPGTPGNRLRYGKTSRNGVMVGKGTRDKIRRRVAGYPIMWAANQVSVRGNGAVMTGPGIGVEARVVSSRHIRTTKEREKVCKRSNTLPVRGGCTPTAVKGGVKNGIKIPGQEGGKRPIEEGR